MENNFQLNNPESEIKTSLWEANPKLKVLLVSLIFTFLISGIGLVAYNVWLNQVDERISQETALAIPKHKEELLVVYKNSDYGFELTYPKNWHAYENDLGSFEIYPNEAYANDRPGDYTFSVEPKIAISSGLDGRADLVCPSTTDVKISGLSGIRCVSKESGITTYYYRVKDIQDTQWKAGNMISFSIPNEHAELLPVYEKILNSLKITPTNNISDTTSWKTYRNEEYGFEFKYGNNIKVEDKKQSINLGTYENPVYGIDILGGTLIPLNKSDLKTKAQGIFNQMSSYVDLPENQYPDGMPPPSCVRQDIKNLNLKVEAVYCVGEGGPAYYAYISGAKLDLFYDGYPARDLNLDEINKILATFKFTK
jgi:hypothetical protein